MSTQKVIDKILEDAKKEAQEIIAQHKSEADTVKKDYNKRIAQKKTIIENQIAEAKNTEIMRAISQRRLELNKDVTKSKQELINATITEAVKIFTQQKEYVQFLKTLVKNSGETEGELLLNNKDLKKYGNELEKYIRNEKFRVKIVGTDDIKGGIIIRKEQTSYIGSLEIILELLSDKLAIAVSKILFQEK